MVPAPVRLHRRHTAGRTSSSSAAASSRSSSGTTSCGSPCPTTTSSRRRGVLQNPSEVLTADQRTRLARGGDGAERPVFVVTPGGGDARTNESRPPEGTRTWVFHAEERARLRLRLVAQVHLGRRGHEVDGGIPVMAHVLLPEGGRAPLEPLLDPRDRPHARRLLEVHLPLPLPRRHLRQRPGRRDGVPDDLLQRSAAGGGRDLLRAHEVRADLGDHPRGRAQLVPDDRQLRRAPVDVDGRGPQHVPAVPRRAGVGGGLPLVARRAPDRSSTT